MYVCFIVLLNGLLVEVENADDLKPIVEKLQSAFDLLVIKVEHTLKANVSLRDVKKLIDRKLHSIYTEVDQKMAEYRQKLHGIQDMDSLFNDFLLKFYFISYLNYALLKEVGALAEDEIIASKFEEYEKSYVKLISNASFKNLMSVFHQHPDLKPTAPIGLPKILFHLNEYWQDKSILNWITTFFGGLSWFEWCLLCELRKKCIVVTYAVLPSVLSDVLEYLKSSAVQQKFQEMGISVELPEDLGKNKC